MTETEKSQSYIIYFEFVSHWSENKENVIMPLLNFKVLKSKNFDKKILELIKSYQSKPLPKMPIDADLLMTKYKIPQGKMLGDKLKKIEEEWVNNGFDISSVKLETIVKN